GKSGTRDADRNAARCVEAKYVDPEVAYGNPESRIDAVAVARRRIRTRHRAGVHLKLEGSADDKVASQSADRGDALGAARQTQSNIQCQPGIGVVIDAGKSVRREGGAEEGHIGSHGDGQARAVDRNVESAMEIQHVPQKRQVAGRVDHGLMRRKVDTGDRDGVAGRVQLQWLRGVESEAKG